MPRSIQDIINQYVSSIKNIYGKHIKQIILYGSYARGDFHKGSDVDIMVLVDSPNDQIESYSDMLSELGFEYNVTHDIWFMPIIKNIKHFSQWCTVYPFYTNVMKEGVILYETT